MGGARPGMRRRPVQQRGGFGLLLFGLQHGYIRFVGEYLRGPLWSRDAQHDNQHGDAETTHRDAWIWLLRVTTGNAGSPCVSDGNIVAGTSTSPIVTFNLGLVDGCEYPYDTVGCQ